VLALVARSWAQSGQLTGGGVVGTVMSNLGLQRFLGTLGLTLERAPVGDRYVVERMREGGFNVGGEQSGHVVLSDHTTTGDGLIAALQILAVLVQSGRRASDVTRVFEPLPQILKNIRFNGGAPLEDKRVIAAIKQAETALGESGRLLVRKSGTEPLIRVMGEGQDARQVGAAVDSIISAITGSAGG